MCIYIYINLSIGYQCKQHYSALSFGGVTICLDLMFCWCVTGKLSRRWMEQLWKSDMHIYSIPLWTLQKLHVPKESTQKNRLRIQMTSWPLSTCNHGATMLPMVDLQSSPNQKRNICVPIMKHLLWCLAAVFLDTYLLQMSNSEQCQLISNG